jgi:hypothetical protein
MCLFICGDPHVVPSCLTQRHLDAESASVSLKGFWGWFSLIAECWLLNASFRSMAMPAFRISPQGTQFFSFLGEFRPFCILGRNIPANKARNRPCSISRAERIAYRPKFSASFRQYTCPLMDARAVQGVQCSSSVKCAVRLHLISKRKELRAIEELCCHSELLPAGDQN